MPLDKTIEFTPVVTGKMTEVPPDLPDGHWNGTIAVRNGKDADGHPRIFIEFTAQEDLAGGNESFVGSSASDMVTFYPENDSRSKMNRVRMKALCEAWPDVPEPDTDELANGNWDSLEPFVEALEASQREFWTTLSKPDKEGVVRTRIHYKAPGQKLTLKPAAEPDEAEEEEKPKAKTNGHAAKKGKK